MFGTRVFGVLGLCTKRRYNDIYQLVLRLLVSARLHEIHGMFVVCARCTTKTTTATTREELSPNHSLWKRLLRDVFHTAGHCALNGSIVKHRRTYLQLLLTAAAAAAVAVAAGATIRWCALAHARAINAVYLRTRACARLNPSSFMMCAASVQVYCSGLLRVCLWFARACATRVIREW